MKKSLFENFSDKQMIKYMRYALPLLNELDRHIEYFSDEIYGTVEKQLAAPIGGSLSRLDKEYLFYLYINNENLDGENINRPTLNERTINFIVKERQVTYTTHSEDLATYVDEYIDQNYLYHLKDNDEIDPWSWAADTEYGDSDYIDDEFDY